jgi:hypothetical protein
VTASLALWYAFTTGWGASVGAQAWRGRFAPAHFSTLFVAFCSLYLHFVPMLVAVPTLLACGASIAEHRAGRRQLLLSETLTPGRLLRGQRSLLALSSKIKDLCR